MATTKDQSLSKFSEYFIYSKVTGMYRFSFPESMKDSDGVFILNQETKDKVSFEEKEVFVRYMASRADLDLRAVKELGLEVKYYFEDPNFTSDNEFSYTR